MSYISVAKTEEMLSKILSLSFLFLMIGISVCNLKYAKNQ